MRLTKQTLISQKKNRHQAALMAPAGTSNGNLGGHLSIYLEHEINVYDHHALATRTRLLKLAMY